MKKISIFVSMLVFLPLSTFAHGGGQSLEQPVGEYIVNLEYDRFELSAGEITSFGVNLSDKTGNPVDFSTVLFEVIKGEKTLLAVFTSKSEFDEANIDYSFPEGGDYKIGVKFVNNGKGIVEAIFDLSVESGEEIPWYRQSLFIATTIVIAAGVAASLMAYRAGKKSRK